MSVYESQPTHGDPSGPPIIDPAAGRAEGERLRDAAHALLAARRSALVRAAQRAMLMRLLGEPDATATVDDVRRDLGAAIGPGRTQWLGVAVRQLAVAGVVRRAGWAATCRREAHARPISAWALADADAARAWLAAHLAPAPEGAS